ncbi:MAG TPA: phosphoribosylglycinamide formyltransferase [Steroidobacteraceae bacterium]|nr:phosphoribosylglycinamide formyltransferase [Steroidobacteraceae bacterium]
MSEPRALPIAILISGRGSNMLAIARACADGRIHARVSAVIGDRPDAGGLARAEALGLATHLVPAGDYPDRTGFEAALQATLARSGAQLVALAGFMRILSADFVERYAGRMLNIHPSLLPRHPGLHTHRRVLQAGEREHGASVHFVTRELDGGPVICQGRLAVYPQDSEQSLSERVQRLEHRIYPRVIGLYSAGRLALRGSTVLLDGQPLAAPLQESEQDDQGRVRADAC